MFSRQCVKYALQANDDGFVRRELQRLIQQHFCLVPIARHHSQLRSKIDGVLIISARNSLEDKVFALKAGADDYLTKPFHLAELGARVAAIIRRKSFEGKNQVVLNELTLDLSEKGVRVNNKPVDLTRKEYELLLYFIGNKNKVIAKNAIAEHLWGDNMDLADNYDFIYTHIKNLRKKLIQAGAADYIKSVYGMGYKFDV